MPLAVIIPVAELPSINLRNVCWGITIKAVLSVAVNYVIGNYNKKEL